MSYPLAPVAIPALLASTRGVASFIVRAMRGRHPITVFGMNAGDLITRALTAERGPQQAGNLMENILVLPELPLDEVVFLVTKAWEMPVMAAHPRKPPTKPVKTPRKPRPRAASR